MITAQLLLSHLNYSEWASGRALAAALELTPEELTRDHGTSEQSVLGTLVHMFAADRLWLARVRGEAAGPFIEESDYSLDVLRRDWPGIHAGWRDWLASLTADGFAREVQYSDLKGRTHVTPAWQIVLQVVNHGTHHRGQVSGFLRMMGRKPQPLDLVVYYRGL